MGIQWLGAYRHVHLYGQREYVHFTFRAGSGTFLAYSALGCMGNQSSPTLHAVMRRALQTYANTFANLAALPGVESGSYVYCSMSPRRIVLIAVDVVVALLVIGSVLWMIRCTIADKRNSGKYKTAESMLQEDYGCVINYNVSWISLTDFMLNWAAPSVKRE